MQLMLTALVAARAHSCHHVFAQLLVPLSGATLLLATQ